MSTMPCLNKNMLWCSYRMKHSVGITILSTRVKTSLDLLQYSSPKHLSASPIGFIKCSGFSFQTLRSFTVLGTDVQVLEKKGGLDALPAPVLQRGFVELGRGGECSIQALSRSNCCYVAQRSFEEGYSVDMRDPQLPTDRPHLCFRDISSIHGWHSVHWKHHVSKSQRDENTQKKNQENANNQTSH